MLGEGAVSNEGGTVNYSIQTIDASNVGNALAAMAGTSSDGFTFGSDALYTALGFGGKALQMAGNVTSDALGFADANSSRNSAMAYNALGDALASNESALSKAFSFGKSALDQSFSNLNDTETLVANAYNDAKGRGALTDKILIGAIAAMAVVAFAAVKK